MIAIPNFNPKDGLYQIDKGRIHKYKGKGGTVRVYDLIEIDEPKRGKWIDHKEIIYTDPEIWGYSQECSLCGFTLGAKEYNYCPNCGAKMERRADEVLER